MKTFVIWSETIVMKQDGVCFVKLKLIHIKKRKDEINKYKSLLFVETFYSTEYVKRIK